MHSEVRARLYRGGATTRYWLPRCLAVLFPCSLVGSMLGQGVLVPPPGFQGAPAVPTMGNVSPTVGQPNAQANGQANGTSVVPNSSGETTAPATDGEASEKAAAAPLASLMEWGALHIHARASYQFSYETGLNSAPGQSSGGSYSQTFAPGFNIQIGPHVSLDYSTIFRFFSEKDFHNTIDHAISLTAGAHFGDWTFGLAQNFAMTDEPTVETSSQTEEKNYSANFNASYQLNDKVSFDTSLGMALEFLGGTNALVNTNLPAAFTAALTDSQSYSAAQWVNYQFDDKISGGLGVTLSYSDQSVGFNSVTEEYLGRLTWHPGAKLTVSVNGGFEDQQFLNSGASDLVTPIFSAAIEYKLFEYTTFSLSASRSVNVSLFQNEVTESTQVGVSMTQRLFGKFQLSLGMGYSGADYKNTEADLTTSRSDKNLSFSAGVTYPLAQHFSTSAFYQYSDNSSSTSAFSYSSSQVGASISWSY